MGGNSQYLQKSSITKGKLAVKSIKTEYSLVRKYNEKTTFLNKNIPQLKNKARKKSISRKLFLYHVQMEIYQK